MSLQASHRRGGVLVYVVVAITSMMAFASLAIDWGRVQLVKTELQRAADAAARYGASGLATSSATAVQNAILAAADNTADGSSVVLTSADVMVGNWNTTTRVFTANGSPRNAVQVTARRTQARGTAVKLTWTGTVPGAPSSVNVGATATAYAEGSVFKGFIGLSSFVAKNNSVGVSYRSSSNVDPNPGNASTRGMFGTNGVMDGKNNGKVFGDLYLGPAGSNDGISVTGSIRSMSSAIPEPVLPAWNPGTNPNSIPQAYSAGTAQLAGGTYWFSSLRVTGALSFSGPTTLYVNGNVDLSGSLLAHNSIPSNLRIYVLGSGRTFGDDSSNDVEICAQVLAPGAALEAKNNMKFRGRGIFRSIETKNNAEYYYDEDDGPAGPSSSISLVK
ncbi:MAG TPA: pilus assembly protein TadG-related protein [Tepidisphaeraceae bacterium]|nr:pilus assembly protein TadG-related protein [Tepidisphaeraceae bacterium]